MKFVIQWFLNQSHIRNNWKPFKNHLLNLRWVPGFGNFSKSSIVVVQWLSHIQLFATLWTAARQASLSVTNSQILLKLMSIKSVMPSNHLILCHPLLLLPTIFPSIRVFSNESTLRIRWPKYWSFSFNISPSDEHPRLSRVFSNTTVQKHQFFGTQLPGASVRNSARGKGHKEGGSAYSKAGSSLRSPPGNSRASTPKIIVCLLYCFVLSPTPLTLRGAVLGMTRVF